MPKDTPAYTEAQMLLALTKSEGFITTAAGHLKCSAKTVERYVRRYPSLRQLIDQLKEKHLDQIENVLLNRARKGDPWAVIFFLKTRGRLRGYTEKYEISHEFRDKTDADLITFIEERTRRIESFPSGNGTPGAETSAIIEGEFAEADDT